MAKGKYLVIASALLLLVILANFALAHMGRYDRKLPREESYLEAMEEHHKDMQRMHNYGHNERYGLRGYNDLEMPCG